MVPILKSAFTSMVPLQHSNACIRQSCEVGNRPIEGLQSHPSSQLFVASDVHQFRHGLAHVRQVATPNGPNKNSISFASDLTRAIDTVPSFVQWDVAQRWPVVREVALGINVATLTWPSVRVKPNTWKSWGLGVLRDSRMFRARQQDPKHLALRCS
jgi:hypothetical protein